MRDDIFTFLIGGKAGEGVKKAGSAAGRLFSRMGRRVFQMDDYQSLIRGGHSFSAVSTSRRKIMSHYLQANLVIALDYKSFKRHRDHLSSDGILVYNSDTVTANGLEEAGIGMPLTKEAKKYPNSDMRLGVGGIAILAAAAGVDKKGLGVLIKDEYPRDVDNNIAYAMAIYDIAYPSVGGKYRLKKGDKEQAILSGNEAIALGASAGGLDVYYAYPMTPASSILHYLAAHDRELGITVVHPENEIGVIHMAIGSAFSGARTMIGTSGGGFALMEEAFSMAGMSEAPILCVLSSRPGPSTGVPTYTIQGDLKFAINQGHGEFPRIVASPGSIEEAFYLTAELLMMVWRFQIPGILLTEKHLSESRMTVHIDVEGVKDIEPLMHGGGEYKRYLDTTDGISPLLFSPEKEVIKWTSYEHDEKGFTTEIPEDITKMTDKRNRKYESIKKRMKGLRTVNRYGKNGPLILTYGSTTMSVLEALDCGGIDAQVVQPIYLEPLPVWELADYRGRDAIVIEQSSTGQFESLIKERTGIIPGANIRRYDGRPFDPVKLANEIKGVIGDG